MHDAISFETAGIPAATIVLEVFKELALAKRRQMGRPDFEPVIVPGYISVPDHAREQAELALPGVIEWLTTGAGKPAGERAQLVGARS